MHLSLMKWQKAGNYTGLWYAMQIRNPFHIAKVVSCSFCMENYVLQNKITTFYVRRHGNTCPLEKKHFVFVRGQRSSSRCDEWRVHVCIARSHRLYLLTYINFRVILLFFPSIVELLFAFLVQRRCVRIYLKAIYLFAAKPSQ